jgi:hypothetical protein
LFVDAYVYTATGFSTTVAGYATGAVPVMPPVVTKVDSVVEKIMYKAASATRVGGES